MHTFDFIDSLAAAYGFLWRNRRLVAALACVALFIKIACFIVVYALGLEEAWLRQGLLYLPAYFAEGVLLARLAVLAGRGGDILHPLPAPGDRRIMAATLAYVLIKLVLALAGGLGMMFVAEQQALQEGAPIDQQTSLIFFFGSIFMMGFSLWAFRFVWLYIPLAQGYSPLEFLARVKGMRISFVLIGMWLLCFVPMMLALVMMAGMLADLAGHTDETPSQIYRFLIIIVQSGLELLAITVSSLAVGFGVHHIMDASAARGRKGDNP